MTPIEIVEGMRKVQAQMQALVIAAQALQGAPVEKSGRKYTEADRDRWREIARQPDLMLHSNRSKARLIALREGLSTGATETIRRAL